MHKIFTIHHIADEIFSYMSQHELSVLARVSSDWFQCAISLLYKNQEITFALFPLGKNHGTLWRKLGRFNIPPSDEDFERFLTKYAPCVRSITVDSLSIYAASWATQKCVVKNITYLFPNVREVILHPELSQSRYIEWLQVASHVLPPDVRRLHLGDIVHPILFHDLCSLVKARITSLDALGIGEFPTPELLCSRPIDKATHSLVVEPAQKLLTWFGPTLLSVSIPPALMNPSIVQCLSEMPNLWGLSIGSHPSSLSRTAECDVSYNNCDKFSSLRSLSYGGSLQFFDFILWGRYNLTFLTVFAWTADHVTPADVDMVISAIAIHCPRLSSLIVGPDQCWDSRTEGFVVPWSFIQPVIRCKELTRLSLTATYVSVDPEELTEFLKNRKTWTYLDIFTWYPFRPKDILLFAEHCQNLEHLGIHLDDCADYYDAVDLPSDIPTFSTLDSIYFANSNFTKLTARPLSQFLCRILKKPVYHFGGLGRSDDHTTYHLIKHLAISYIDQQGRTGIPMSAQVREFVKHAIWETR